MRDLRFVFCGVVTATLVAASLGCSSSSSGGGTGGTGGSSADCSGVIDATLEGDATECLVDTPLVTARTTDCSTSIDDTWGCGDTSCSGTATLSGQNIAATSTIEATFECGGVDWVATFDPSDKVTFDGKDSHRSVTITFTKP